MSSILCRIPTRPPLSKLTSTLHEQMLSISSILSMTSLIGKSSYKKTSIMYSNSPWIQLRLYRGRVLNNYSGLHSWWVSLQATFNFQQDNFGKGGAGNDRVTVSVQDASGLNNADFATPAEWVRYTLTVYYIAYNISVVNPVVWGCSCGMRQMWAERVTLLPVPHCLSSLSVMVPSKMTLLFMRIPMVSPTGWRVAEQAVACKQPRLEVWVKVRKFIEKVWCFLRCKLQGWSDAMADWTEKTSSAVPDYFMGTYVINDPAGIRTHPYSTSPLV